MEKVSTHVRHSTKVVSQDKLTVRGWGREEKSQKCAAVERNREEEPIKKNSGVKKAAIAVKKNPLWKCFVECLSNKLIYGILQGFIGVSNTLLLRYGLF